MMSNDERLQSEIAEQAGDWFVANDEAPLGSRDAAALAAWLRASPVNVERFLGVSVVARDLRQAGSDPAYSLDAMLALARSGDEAPIPLQRPRLVRSVHAAAPRRWRLAATALAACAVSGLVVLSFWQTPRTLPTPAAEDLSSLRFETRHGQTLSQRLADGSVLHLNTDSAVTVRYGKAERVITLAAGQASFEVAHEPDRAFRVIAGSAEVIDIGTKFDVRLTSASTVITVIEGRVLVEPSPGFDGPRAATGSDAAARVVELRAEQQLSVTAGQWQSGPVTADAQRATAWLRRQIVFEREPLERVAAEFNRYAPKPIEIATPALRALEISGVFATDDTEAFIAFLRSLKGVRVEVTAARIRVVQETGAEAHGFT